MSLPKFDEVHVISDIHMGGKEGFQILRETARLAGFIRWVAKQRPNGQVALVLNGDIVDTLAEEMEGYIALDNAVDVVGRIIDDASFRRVWDALAVFTQTANRTLVIVLGNHDLELSFPAVQRLVIERLAGSDPAARARIEFSTIGAGFPCMVGNARVYCTHGNEVDPWNYVRYEDLSKAARRLAAGRALEHSEWQPNAGTKMVKEVMNAVKKRYAWIDLMKPETTAAVGVLLALDPGQLSKIRSLAPVLGELSTGKNEFDERLSAGGFARPDPGTARKADPGRLLGPRMMSAVTGGGKSADDMLRTAERTFRDPAAAPAAPAAGTLGTGQLIWDRLTGWLTGVKKEESLRSAIADWLKDDQTFNPANEDDTYKAMLSQVGAQVDFVITGHTHLDRAIAMGPNRFYLNTGTWIRLLRFTPDMLTDEATFKPVYDVLLDGSMASIDRFEFGGKPFVLDQTSAVCIRADGAKVTGELVRVSGDGTKRKAVTTFVRS